MAKSSEWINVHPIEGEEISHLYKGLKFNTHHFDPSFKNGSRIIIGASGSGKEDRTKFFAETYGGVRYESGTIFRDLAAKAGKGGISELGSFAMQYEAQELEQMVNDLPHLTKVVGTQFNHLDLSMPDIGTIFSMLRGLFVPDYLANPRFAAQIGQTDLPVNLDGHVRSKGQAQFVTELLDSRGTPVAGILLVHANLEDLMERLTNRRLCPDPECKAGYNLQVKDESDSRYISNPQIGQNGYLTGFCCKPIHADKPVELIRRNDDNPQAVETRLQQFIQYTIPALHAIQEQAIPIWVVTGQLPKYSKALVADSINAAIYSTHQPRTELGLRSVTPLRLAPEQAIYTPSTHRKN